MRRDRLSYFSQAFVSTRSGEDLFLTEFWSDALSIYELLLV